MGNKPATVTRMALFSWLAAQKSGSPRSASEANSERTRTVARLPAPPPGPREAHPKRTRAPTRSVAVPQAPPPTSTKHLGCALESAPLLLNCCKDNLPVLKKPRRKELKHRPACQNSAKTPPCPLGAPPKPRGGLRLFAPALTPPARYHLRCPGSIASRCFEHSGRFEK